MAVAAVSQRRDMEQHKRRHVGQLHGAGSRRRNAPAGHGDLRRREAQRTQRKLVRYGNSACAADTDASGHCDASAHGDSAASADSYGSAADTDVSAAAHSDSSAAYAYRNGSAADSDSNGSAAHADSDDSAASAAGHSDAYAAPDGYIGAHGDAQAYA